MAPELITKHASRFTLPLLISHGTNDKLTCCEASKEFFNKVKSADKTYQEWDSFFHELHNEPADDRAKVLNLYVEWIKARA
jgi:acylglycerol lipase